MYRLFFLCVRLVDDLSLWAVLRLIPLRRNKERTPKRMGGATFGPLRRSKGRPPMRLQAQGRMQARPLTTAMLHDSALPVSAVVDAY